MLQTATKSDLMQIIDDERDWWDTLVARATPDQMESIRITDDWTIRDLAAHLLSWWEWRLARLDAAVNNQPKPDPPFPANLQSIDQQNAWFHQQKQSRSAEDLTRAFSESFDQLKAIVSRLSEDELTDPNRTPFLDGKSLATSIADDTFFGHVHQQHTKEIEAWQRETANAG